MSDLTIIIVSYNTKEIIKSCIESIVNNIKGINYKIIVVDNSSKDGSVKYLKEFKKENKNVSLILNKDNIGFGKANNQGLKRTKSRYFLLINSDTIIKSNILKSIVEWMDNNKNVGIVTCALKNSDGTLQGTGGYFPTIFRVFAWMFFLDDIPILDKLIKPFHPMHQISPFYKGSSFYEMRQEVDWVTGAFVFGRTKVVKQVGYFDEDYFMYTEDVDLCFRIKKKGWKVFYLPEWSIIHLGGASSTNEFPLINEFKGVKMFYKKNMPKWQYLIMKNILKGGVVLRMFMFGLLKGPKMFNTYAKAYKVI